jgi:integrase
MNIATLPMVCDSLKGQARRTRLRSKYIFLDVHDKSVEIETLRKNVWSKELKKAGPAYRPVIQAWHTFATMMTSSGKSFGCVQKMMGHASLKMITDEYFSYIPNMTHNDGSKFLSEYEKKT